ncbi:MAG: GspH/FimT family pseudopilin [Vicinamibacterales bacterium]
MKFRARSARGFTYLELLVVVGIIGVAAAVSIPALNNAVERNRVISASELVAAQFREARLSAITRNRTFRLRFDCADGALRVLVVTGTPAVDNAADRCTTRQPEDGTPVYLPPSVSLGEQPPPSLDVNGRGLVTAAGGNVLPQSISITNGAYTRTLVVSATGRISTPAS